MIDEFLNMNHVQLWAISTLISWVLGLVILVLKFWWCAPRFSGFKGHEWHKPVQGYEYVSATQTTGRLWAKKASDVELSRWHGDFTWYVGGKPALGGYSNRAYQDFSQRIIREMPSPAEETAMTTAVERTGSPPVKIGA